MPVVVVIKRQMNFKFKFKFKLAESESAESFGTKLHFRSDRSKVSAHLTASAVVYA